MLVDNKEIVVSGRFLKTARLKSEHYIWLDEPHSFIAKIKEEEGLTELLKDWEPKLEKGISISGQEIPALVSYFKAANYQGATFRYQTLSRDDFGICYSIFNDYFILTSSGESMLKIIDKLGEYE